MSVLSRSSVRQLRIARQFPCHHIAPPLRQYASLPLAPTALVNQWMQDRSLCQPEGLFGHPRMWVMLRILPGLDLPDFLEGSRLAYDTVTRLMYTRDWDSLQRLVSPELFAAMQDTMDEMADHGQKILDCDESDISVRSAVLKQVLVFDEHDCDARKCHLDVHIVSEEKWKLFDYHSNEVIPPFDGRARTQESTWRFEGFVGPELKEQLASLSEKPSDRAHNHIQASSSWIIRAIV